MHLKQETNEARVISGLVETVGPLPDYLFSSGVGSAGFSSVGFSSGGVTVPSGFSSAPSGVPLGVGMGVGIGGVGVFMGFGAGGILLGLAGGAGSAQPIEKAAKAATRAKPINFFIRSFLVR